MRSERRSAARFSLSFPALIKWSAQPVGTRLVELQTSNISAHGVFFRTQMRVPLDTRVLVDLISQPPMPLPSGGIEPSHISIPGRALRQDKAGLVIVFDRDYRISAIQDRLAMLYRELHWIRRHQGIPDDDRLSIVS